MPATVHAIVEIAEHKGIRRLGCARQGIAEVEPHLLAAIEELPAVVRELACVELRFEPVELRQRLILDLVTAFQVEKPRLADFLQVSPPLLLRGLDRSDRHEGGGQSSSAPS